MPVNVRGIPHGLLASVLAYEYGIGVRNGCFCAHPYLKFLLNVEGDAEKKLIEDILSDNRSAIPGAVRISFGFYNEEEELDRLISALHSIVKNKERIGQGYSLNIRTGEYYPEGYSDRFEKYFTL